MTELTLEEAGALPPLVTPAQAAQQGADGAVLIDVRSAAGRAAAGAITDAVLVPKDQVDQRFALDSPDRVAVVESADTPVVVVCGSVRGSGPVAAQLIGLGFRNVVQVEGGFSAWQEAGLPTEPPTA